MIQLNWYATAEIDRSPQYVVKNLLQERALSVIYGESGSGKSFFVLDLAAHVAGGQSWRGNKVNQGAVVYIAAEGGASFGNRLCAIRSALPWAQSDLPICYVRYAPNLLLPEEDGDLGALIEAVQQAEDACGVPVSLIVIDTLSRALAGGNENSPEDMGALIANVDHLRRLTGAHVCIVHHSGKDAAKGARGHSSLRAAVDTEIEIARTDSGSLARVTKQRDLGSEGRYGFHLEPIDLGADDDGDPITSCVVVHDDDVDKRRGAEPHLSNGAKIALAQLRNAAIDAGQPAPGSRDIPSWVTVVSEDLWRRRCYEASVSDSDKPDSKRKAYSRAATELITKGVVGKFGNWVWLCNPDNRTDPDTSGTVH